MRKQWNNYEIKLKNPTIISKDLLKVNVNKFWDKYINRLDDNQIALFILRIKFENNQTISASTLQRIDKTSKNDIIEYLHSRISLSNEAYSTTPIKSLIFSFGIREGKLDSNNLGRETDNKSNIETKFQLYYKHKLPILITGKINEYGRILSSSNNQYTIFVNNNTLILLESLIENNQQVNKVKYIRNGQIIYNWTDTVIGLTNVVREIGKSVYYYENGELVLIKIEKKSKAMEITKTRKKINNKIITMDLETVLVDNVHTPYLLSWFDGNITKSYFLNDLDPVTINYNILKMVNSAMDDICIKKYRNYKIYFHNFSKFDGYFLIKYLAKIGTCDPIIHKGKILSVKFAYNNYNITFKDSYLLLPSSLRKLCESFVVKSAKGIFPYGLMDLNYIGLVPDFKLFSRVRGNIDLDIYENYKKSFANKKWNFRNESIKYCELDCISLYQVLTKFNTLIFNRFKLNINKYPTLPSLSFDIFRSQYLKKDSIHMLSGNIANEIRQGYTGGACDMYIPSPSYFSPLGPCSEKKIYAYDVNSLYPYVMAKCKLPIGKPTYFEGDITKLDKNAFGFFYCKIIAPKNLKHPIIQTRVKTNDGLRTVAPLGSWNDMIFSEEMYNAMKYGYKFEVLWGYTFESDLIFDGFVKDLYQIRLEYPKSDPMNYVAKIIMNSLYGRFGMDDNFVITSIMSKEDYFKFEELDKDNSILDVINLDDNLIVQSKNPKVELDTLLDNGNEVHNVNISIAAAVTAYARIHMSQFKNNKKFKLYYSDTDSIYTDKPLPLKFIGNGLGLLKLEYICKDAIFLAPKVYGLLTDNGLIVKIKGLSNEALTKISMEDLKDLLVKDSNLESKQEKWYKDISNGNISVKDQIYTLKVTGNKRELIYKNDILINTKPLMINSEKEIES